MWATLPFHQAWCYQDGRSLACSLPGACKSVAADHSSNTMHSPSNTSQLCVMHRNNTRRIVDTHHAKH